MGIILIIEKLYRSLFIS